MVKNLMEHGILYRLELSPSHSRRYTYQWIDLLEPILQYAARLNIDPKPMAKWLLLGWRLIHGHYRDWDVLDLEIQDLSRDERNIVLEIINNWTHSLEGLEITLHKADSTLTLPKSLKRVDLWIGEEVSPYIIPRIIAPLPALGLVNIHVDFRGAEEGKPLFTGNPLIIPQGVRESRRRYTIIEISLRSWNYDENITWKLEDEDGESKVIDNVEKCDWLDEVKSWFYERDKISGIYIIIKNFRAAGGWEEDEDDFDYNEEDDEGDDDSYDDDNDEDDEDGEDTDDFDGNEGDNEVGKGKEEGERVNETKGNGSPGGNEVLQLADSGALAHN